MNTPEKSRQHSVFFGWAVFLSICIISAIALECSSPSNPAWPIKAVPDLPQGELVSGMDFVIFHFSFIVRFGGGPLPTDHKDSIAIFKHFIKTCEDLRVRLVFELDRRQDGQNVAHYFISVADSWADEFEWRMPPKFFEDYLDSAPTLMRLGNPMIRVRFHFIPKGTYNTKTLTIELPAWDVFDPGRTEMLLPQFCTTQTLLAHLREIYSDPKIQLLQEMDLDPSYEIHVDGNISDHGFWEGFAEIQFSHKGKPCD